MSTSPSFPVTNPDWYGTIRKMFTQTDIDHMSSMGLDLTSYDQVRASAGGIYGQVSTGAMPPGHPWSPDMVQTFLNWMSAGYPKGAPTQALASTLKAATSGSTSPRAATTPTSAASRRARCRRRARASKRKAC